MNAAGIFGRVVPATFAPKLGTYNLLIICTTGMAALLFSLLAVKNTGGLLTFAVLFGLFDGGSRYSPLAVGVRW
jgi:ABC-type uncharacterized transport system permease subunit